MVVLFSYACLLLLLSFFLGVQIVCILSILLHCCTTRRSLILSPIRVLLITLLFFLMQSLLRLIDFLRHYEAEAVLGQLISQAKSSFYIKCLASTSCYAIVHSITQFFAMPITYFRCLVYRGFFKNTYFDDMIQKVGDKISNWANQLLSFGGN